MRAGIALLHRLLCPMKRALRILGHALALAVQDTKHALCVRVASLGERHQFIERGAIISARISGAAFLQFGFGRAIRAIRAAKANKANSDRILKNCHSYDHVALPESIRR